MGYPVHRVGLAEALAVAEAAVQRGNPLHVITLNPEMVMQAERDAHLAGILKIAGLVLPDGAGVVWALRRQGFFDVARLPGIEFSEALIARAAEKLWPVALVGASEASVEKASQVLQERYPGLSVVYRHSGFFESLQQQESVARACAESQPRLVFVALGVPRQEKWIAQYRRLFAEGTVFVGVGGSFDVWSGMVERAPAFFCKMNLEWAYRFAKQPWRIRRAGGNLARFALKVILERPFPARLPR
jgi:N-acetylglucosaminyldiphosphoundecaprenol N-acetyl-beta-D-mannosaminyltransferase